jgi:hypothetical protein
MTPLTRLANHVIEHGGLDRHGNRLLLLERSVLVFTNTSELLEADTTAWDAETTEERAVELLEELGVTL